MPNEKGSCLVGTYESLVTGPILRLDFDVIGGNFRRRARAGAEVVQLYLSDPVAQVVRPVRWLAGFTRVSLEPGQARRVVFGLHADRTAFHGLAGDRIVEPGEIRVAIGGASDHLPLNGSFTLTGPQRIVGPGRVLHTPVSVHDLPR